MAGSLILCEVHKERNELTKQANRRVLVADDQADVLEAVRLLLKGERFEVQTVTSPAETLAALDQSDFDLALIDLNYMRDTTSGQEGLELLDKIRKLDSALPVVVMTAWGSVDLAVEAMRRGARDFIEKPWANERLLSVLHTQIELGQALQRGEHLEAENRLLRGDEPAVFIAESPSMGPVKDIIARVGPSQANVLIMGENGAGKGVVARALHAASDRASKHLITVNVGGLSEGVFESELFGHVKGAYTDAKADRIGRFELADGGTIFLDEIANLSPAMQAKLLRVLETGEMERVGSSRTKRVNVRVLSATNADLEQALAHGAFRRDLLFRLNTVEIHVPPLRERPKDIPLLAAYFMRRHTEQYHRIISGFSEEARGVLLRHPWPGNVRELDHTVERAVLMAQNATITANDLGLRGGHQASQRLEDLSLEEVERLLIRKALGRYDGNVSRAAKALGLSRSSLYRRIVRHGL